MPRYRQYRVYPHDEEFGFSPGFYGGGRLPDPQRGAQIEPSNLGYTGLGKPGETILHVSPDDPLPRNTDQLLDMVQAGQVTSYYYPNGWTILGFDYTEPYPTKKRAKEDATKHTRGTFHPYGGLGRPALKNSFYGYAKIITHRTQPRDCLVEWSGIIASMVSWKE